ncbi:MAG TPA: ribose-5-phosphate isomerase RpiA [Anaeromyxobacter sp.]|nr:ribose-5-phosphate isomerase RpiA [Anaeromyxobacter sp.]HVP62970.1 ribose-5-phosphate isomerase RpiA [Myxococcaceae bacterium]
MMPTEERDRAKYAAGVRAIDEYFRDGMVVGLGSGTTSHWMVRALAPRIHDGLKVIGVPTSKATRDLAASLDIPLADLNDHLELDVTLDGPDEIDRQGRMIKGGGACLLWEKIVAAATRRYVVIADDRKLVDVLGRFPLPVEVVPFGWRSTERLMRELFASYGHRDVPMVLRGGEAKPVITDSGHYLLDCSLGRIPEADELAVRLNTIPGVVENGLFVDVGDAVVYGHSDGSADVVVL